MPSQSKLRQEISQQIYETLKSGDVLPWRRGWQADVNAGLPTNATSRRRYSGVNTILLSIAGFAKGHQSKFWATYKQFQALGTNVRRGEKGTAITFFKPLSVMKEDKRTGEEKETTIPLLRRYYVWNVEQTDGCDHLRVGNSVASDSVIDSHAEAENLMAATKANIRFGGNRAYWSPTTDHVQLPLRSQFDCMNEFYLTAMHELSHWTGAKNRLARNGLSYGHEELVAEISAAYTCSELWIPVQEDLSNVESYIGNWLKSIKKDPSFIFKASSAASKASDYLLSFRRQESQEPQQVALA